MERRRLCHGSSMLLKHTASHQRTKKTCANTDVAQLNPRCATHRPMKPSVCTTLSATAASPGRAAALAAAAAAAPACCCAAAAAACCCAAAAAVSAWPCSCRRVLRRSSGNVAVSATLAASADRASFCAAAAVGSAGDGMDAGATPVGAERRRPAEPRLLCSAARDAMRKFNSGLCWA